MGRWQPDAQGRLERAAMDLFQERGYDATTVAEIAERAALTERTFFRHYADKREVLFPGAGQLEQFLVERAGQAPAGTPPLETLASAFIGAATDFFEEHSEFARARQAIISSNEELRERELIKLAHLAGALAGVLRQRDVPEPTASLAGEAGVAAFRVAFDRWVADAGGATLAGLIREAVDALAALSAGRRRPAGPDRRPPPRRA